MKKILLTILLAGTFLVDSFAQVQSIRPDSAIQGQTLTTTITMANGTFSLASAPYQSSDIYLQQGGTTIYTYAGYSTFNVYYPYDSLWTEFTIPFNAPGGYYDVHVVTYDFQGFPTDNVLTNGFHVGYFAGSVEGDLYFDTNQNGIRNGGEPPLYNHRVQVSPNNLTIFSDLAGHYKAYLDSGNYTISYLP
ncbi:MAG: hypothetical protein ABI763_07885, partial [Bacteroidota bacterium]